MEKMTSWGSHLHEIEHLFVEHFFSNVVSHFVHVLKVDMFPCQFWMDSEVHVSNRKLIGIYPVTP